MLPKLLFIHIHKTAGGTFGEVIKSVYGDTCARFTEGDLRNYNKGYVNTYLGDARCVYGHFERHCIEDTADYKLASFIRDPVERTISHYYYLKNNTDKLIGNPTLLEFSEQVANYQTSFLGNVSEYSFVGVTELFDRSVARFLRWVDAPNVSVPTRHKNATSNKPLVDNSTRRIIAELNEEDYRLYSYIVDEFYS